MAVKLKTPEVQHIILFGESCGIKNIVIFYYLNCPSFDFIGSSREKILESQSFVSLDNDFFQNTVKKNCTNKWNVLKKGFYDRPRSGKDKNV